MARSAAAKGAYYKTRTKTWLERRGYTVAYLERVMWIPPKEPGGQRFPIKRDQLGADLLAVNAAEILFVQVKTVRLNTRGGSAVSGAVREFEQFPCPLPARQLIVLWPIRAREPQVVDVAEYRAAHQLPSPTLSEVPNAPRRRRTARTTLF